MPTWDEIFKQGKYIRGGTSEYVYDFAYIIKDEFKDEDLKIWDVGCGAGRHTVFFARYGFNTYATDISENGIKLTKKWLDKENVSTHLKVADVTESPWRDIKFHGILSWNVLQHMSIKDFSKRIEILKASIIPNGLILLSLISNKAQDYGMGEKIEKNSFIHTEGLEKGVIHHYFEEDELKTYFKGWKLRIFIEKIEHIEIAIHKRLQFPLRNAHFIICAQKK
ncbi:MAG: class I SAM-dependent methyltransferase [Candidatus Lokiarchaeota archaeon]|nr:class I SAM-dependent methyltransferase [Candidatus Lokiarchaeota archaeon]